MPFILIASGQLLGKPPRVLGRVSNSGRSEWQPGALTTETRHTLPTTKDRFFKLEDNSF